MLKRLFNLLSPNTKASNLTIIPREQHPISRKLISQSALKVMKRLNEAGFDGFLVGGGVRDLLLDGAPKDFDVATDATPEQVKALFRNSRIIGRRFRIVHVRYGREIIEVTTFRGHNEPSGRKEQRVESDTGQLLRDNVYGDLKSDALRRDFTINALYYTLKDFSIYDYTHGLEDINARQIRIIGDPVTRYKEDPVRLLRAVRFAAKLGFTIEQATAAPIAEHAHLLSNVPAARLFEEVLKLFLSGYATATYHQLKDFALLPQLFASTCEIIDHDPAYGGLIDAVMLNTDKRIRTNKRVTPAFIFAAFLWPPMIHYQRQLVASGMAENQAFSQAANSVIGQQLARTTIPKRFLIPMRQIWELQWRLPQRHGNRAQQLVENPKFRAAYDFLLMREAAGENMDNLGQWWTDYQAASEQQREVMSENIQPPRNKRRRRRPKKKKPNAE